MTKFLVLALAACAMAEDFTDTPFRWPDMLRTGGRIVSILTGENNPRPSKEHYPKWFNKYPLRFVEEIPVPPGDEVAGGEIVVLEYDITSKMGKSGVPIKEAAHKFGFMGQALMDKMSPKHNELGIIAKAADGRELGRYALSLWPIGNDEVKNLNNDVRQRPRMINDTLIVLNRAVVSIEHSKPNTWWGLPSDTKQIHVADLNLKQYKTAMDAIKEYAEKEQYFNDYEVANDKGNLVMPPVTCNTMVEYVVKKATGDKVFDQGMAKIGYLNLKATASKPIKKVVSTKIVRGLMANKKIFNEHYNKDMYIVPAYYDKHGNPRPGMLRDDPEEWYVVWTSDIAWRHNYLKAETFQTTYGFKSAVTEQLLGQTNTFELAERPEHVPKTHDGADPYSRKHAENVVRKRKAEEKKRADKAHAAKEDFRKHHPKEYHDKQKKDKAAEQTVKRVAERVRPPRGPSNWLQNPEEEAEVQQTVKELEASKSDKPKPKIETWFINMDKHKDRKECMEMQLREQGFEPHRDAGVQWIQPAASMPKIKAAGLDDCVPRGINLGQVDDHAAVMTDQDNLRANILSNYCGHKRLIEKLAQSNSTADYFVIFEDDAQLKPWFRLILEDFVQNYEGDWSAVQIDPFFIKSSTRHVKKGLPKLFKDKKIYHGGIISGAQTILLKKERMNDVVTSLNNIQAVPLDHIGRYVDSMIAWKPYISTHPGWFGEKINPKCADTVQYSRIGSNRRMIQKTNKFLAQEGFGDMVVEEEQVDDNVAVNPDEKGPSSVIKIV